MKPLYVRTDDFRLAHRLLSEFQRRGLPALQVGINDPIEGEAYWFGTAEEVKEHGGRGVAVNAEEVAETVSTWLLSRQLTGPPNQLIVGMTLAHVLDVRSLLTGCCLENESWSPLKSA